MPLKGDLVHLETTTSFQLKLGLSSSKILLAFCLLVDGFGFLLFWGAKAVDYVSHMT